MKNKSKHKNFAIKNQEGKQAFMTCFGNNLFNKYKINGSVLQK